MRILVTYPQESSQPSMGEVRYLASKIFSLCKANAFLDYVHFLRIQFVSCRIQLDFLNLQAIERPQYQFLYYLEVFPIRGIMFVQQNLSTLCAMDLTKQLACISGLVKLDFCKPILQLAHCILVRHEVQLKLLVWLLQVSSLLPEINNQLALGLANLAMTRTMSQHALRF